MIYEIINPSDCITIESDDETIACVATILLGKGVYALKDEKGKSVMPLFVFGGLDEWLAERGISDLGAFITKNRKQLAGCLETLLVCDPETRKNLDSAILKDPEMRARFNDENRTSMSDISLSARGIVTFLKSEVEVEVADP